MMPQMPSMPSLDKNSDALEINSGALSSPFAEDSASVESDVKEMYDNVEVKPAIENFDENLQTQVAIRSAPKKGIEVVATRNGFYNQSRYREGDSFLIKSEQEFGEWMKCVDPEMEKKRIEFYKNRKAKK